METDTIEEVRTALSRNLRWSVVPVLALLAGGAYLAFSTTPSLNEEWREGEADCHGLEIGETTDPPGVFYTITLVAIEDGECLWSTNAPMG